MSELISISEVAKTLSATHRTLRFYEEQGLITACRVGPRAVRHYTNDMVDRIAWIIDMRENCDLSIREIRAFLRAAPAGRIAVLEAVQARARDAAVRADQAATECLYRIEKMRQEQTPASRQAGAA